MPRYNVLLSRMETAHCEIEVEAATPGEAESKAREMQLDPLGDYVFRPCCECRIGEVEATVEILCDRCGCAPSGCCCEVL